MKMKTYDVDIQLDVQSVRVRAKNSREAKKKAIAQLKRRSVAKMVDHQNTWTSEV